MKFIVALIMFLSVSVTVYAEELVNAGPLTIERATSNAVNNSRQIRGANEQIEMVDLAESRAEDAFWGSLHAFGQVDIVQRNVRNMQFAANRAFASDSALAGRETLQFVVTNHFSTITTAQNELEILDAEIELLERELIILELMLELGMGSSISVRQARHNLNQQNHNRELLEIALNQNFVELNRIMGTPLHHIFDLIFEIEYAPLGEVNLSRVITNHDRNNINIRNARRQVDIAQEELDNHTITSNQIAPQQQLPDGTWTGGNIVPGQVTRRERELDLSSAQRNLSTERENSENRVRDIYTNIRQLELNIEGIYLQIELLEMNLELMEEQLLAGQITRLDIDRTASNLLRLEESLRQMEATHHILHIQLENTNLLF
ncbi:MAG: TolC family protein [Defluviitaleaceae bacterium]|nr:TolC family protein [Defluviitaleaceae bacterium]